MRSEKSWKDCMMPENSQGAPSLRLCNTRAPQRGDSAVSTFAGRMEQRCVVALGKCMGSWTRQWMRIRYAAGGNWAGGGEEDLRLGCAP